MSGDSAAPHLAFRVFGCRLNQAEAGLWQEALAELGIGIVPESEADVLCVHSCAVTEEAVREVRKTIAAYKRARPSGRLVLSGCAAELLQSDPDDCVIPHAEKDEWFARVKTFLNLDAAESRPPPSFETRRRTRASLIVQDGCDRFCAYCIVPHLRGAPVSEPMSRLLKRAETLFAQGYREIVITGCHLALYRDPESNAGFTELVKRLRDVPGEGRFRIGSLEPCVIDDRELFRTIAAARERLCAFLHFPIQSASDAVLEAMGRTYRAADLHRMLDALGETLPGCGLGADWIVGLPGETEADAEATRAFVEAYPFTGAHVFPYSRRPGTPAAERPDQVPPQEIKRRAALLSETANRVRDRVLPQFLGRPLQVIPERFRNGAWEGWSAERLRCRLTGPHSRGELVPFLPKRIENGLLLGE